MPSDTGRYAQLPDGSNVVKNTILMDASFTIDGYFFIKIGDTVKCEPGSFYNKEDGLFYDDEDLTIIAGSSNSNNI